VCAIPAVTGRVFASQGGVREFISLFLPLLGTSCSNYLFLLIEKLLLVRVSSLDMEAAVSAMYACQIFQGTGIAFAMMTQVFVARWYGERSWTLIGPGTWQFIWFSILSMLVTMPLSFLYGQWYFSGTEVARLAIPYFQLLMGWNFLYPLGMVLACFYLGQGKIRLVFFINLMAQAIKISLAYLLIFGCGSWVPAYGIMGGAMSTIVAQGAFCAVLFCVFLRGKHRSLFHSHAWQFRSSLFWECVRACASRALNRILNFTSWAAIAHLMVARGGESLLIMSVGGVFCLVLPLLFEAICQTQITTISYMIGAQKVALIRKAVRSAFFVVCCIIGIMAIPFLCFPCQFCFLLFPEIALDPFAIRMMLLGVWLCFTFFTLNAIPLSHVLSFKDLHFPILMGCVNWLNGYVLMYYLIEIVLIPPYLFWCALALMHGTTFMIYLWRMRAPQYSLEPV